MFYIYDGQVVNKNNVFEEFFESIGKYLYIILNGRCRIKICICSTNVIMCMGIDVCFKYQRELIKM